jgi:ABC-type phosphate transport system substrate-binding protein
LLIRPEMADATKARAVRDFLNWMVGDEAQQMASELKYAPLPAPVVALVKERINGLTSGGQPIQ